MAVVDGVEFSFQDEDDARAYLRSVGRLWAAWIVGMFALFVTDGWTLVSAAVAVLAVASILVRPLQRRAEAIVPEDDVAAKRRGVLPSRSNMRDRVLRALLYGEEPVLEAVRTSGASQAWVTGRQAVIAATIVGFIGVVVKPLV